MRDASHVLRFNMCNITARCNRVVGTAIGTLCVALLGTLLIPKAAASEWDKKTVVTFNQPVEVPGKALPAGTYVFKLLDSPSNRNIVQIWDKDEKHLIGTYLAVPDYRMKPADKPVINFEERASNAPEAIKAWFYPGDEYGQQFVYPHDQAVNIAKRTNQNVLSMRNEMEKNIKAPAKSAQDSSVQEMKQTEVKGVNPQGEPVEPDAIVQAPPQK